MKKGQINRKSSRNSFWHTATRRYISPSIQAVSRAPFPKSFQSIFPGESGPEKPRPFQGASPFFFARRRDSPVVTSITAISSRYQHRNPSPMVMRKMLSGKGNSAWPSWVIKGKVAPASRMVITAFFHQRPLGRMPSFAGRGLAAPPKNCVSSNSSISGSMAAMAISMAANTRTSLVI